ncbi:SCAN domain-containing protein 3 [Trichonephila clavipes]|nr:SCAN domain-containing protein 3 [Trichonephila clavipes]
MRLEVRLSLAMNTIQLHRKYGIYKKKEERTEEDHRGLDEVRYTSLQKTQFASKYPASEERKTAVDELQKQKQQSSSILSNWMQSASNVNLESFAKSLEIAKKVNPFNTNSNEIHIEPFGIDTGSIEIQFIDLDSKALWSGKFTELKSKLEELEVQKRMYVTQQKLTALKEMPRVEALMFDEWNSLPDCYSEVKKLPFLDY